MLNRAGGTGPRGPWWQIYMVNGLYPESSASPPWQFQLNRLDPGPREPQPQLGTWSPCPATTLDTVDVRSTRETAPTDVHVGGQGMGCPTLRRVHHSFWR